MKEIWVSTTKGVGQSSRPLSSLLLLSFLSIHIRGWRRIEAQAELKRITGQTSLERGHVVPPPSPYFFSFLSPHFPSPITVHITSKHPRQYKRSVQFLKLGSRGARPAFTRRRSPPIPPLFFFFFTLPPPLPSLRQASKIVEDND